ncbi:unnamed protein product [Brassica rapa]|uniref:Uncharacterized protein n=1 Tax=Brassica campestris TaxID=3711 RepID=A0A8D9MBU7_BRACM|nr:unnamed protein product [Brassica rapa]
MQRADRIASAAMSGDLTKFEPLIPDKEMSEVDMRSSTLSLPSSCLSSKHRVSCKWSIRLPLFFSMIVSERSEHMQVISLISCCSLALMTILLLILVSLAQFSPV